MSQEQSPLIYEKKSRAAILRLNRPERLNAVSLPLYQAMETALTDLRDDQSIRVAILTGTGRAFCAGADVKAHAGGQLPAKDRRSYVEAAQRVNRLLQTVPKPVVAAVNGHAIGAGLELALSCDFVVVASEAKLRLPEVSLGTFVGGGLLYTLPQRIGLAKAKEMILLGDFLTGAQAAEIGLANRVVAADEVFEEATALAQELASKAPIPMALAKELFYKARYLPADDLLELEAQALLRCMESSDWREGLKAFKEKREPRYTGE
ncbi:MAG: enoyl-CoA hydratase/isomerase family protein [Gemmatimonadota bacterium]